MRMQGVNSDGEEISSMYVRKAEDFGFATVGPSLTRQEFAEDADVNALMARYENTGQMLPQRTGEPQYLDLSDVPDLHRAMQVMMDAEEAFMSLPAVVRREFDNDSLEFVKFAEDPQNLDKLREWGLAKPAEPAPKPVQVEVVGGDLGGAAKPAPGTSP